MLFVTVSLAVAGCGSGQHPSLIELTGQERALCPGAFVILGGAHGDECPSNPKPGVGQRLEQLKHQIEAACKTAPKSETEQVLQCPGTGKIGG
jgi:hypothetical protein